ncbi:MAG TPA: hypothetical protein VMM17_01790 [Gemmatimonadaceae bacterium]|nr:hypothetical protein [Gemmatimonadaceae bacterium]
MRKSHMGAVMLAVALTGTMAPAAQAQSDEAVAAAIALMLTPAGSFANVSPAALGNSATSLGADYGRYTGDGARNSYGLHLDWHSLRATLGVGTQTGLENVWMAGVSAGRAMFSTTALQVGVEGNAGFGRIKDDETSATLNAMSAGARVPLSMTLNSESVSLVPYVAPGGFFGRLSSEGESESGFRMTLNGGVRVGFNNGVAVDVGVQRIFIDNAETLFGVGLSLTR